MISPARVVLYSLSAHLSTITTEVIRVSGSLAAVQNYAAFGAPRLPAQSTARCLQCTRRSGMAAFGCADRHHTVGFANQ